MPMYTISSRKLVPDTIKSELAQLIVKVHCELTGAPETFVNVVFSQAVPLRTGIDHEVFGAVRKGRTETMKQTLEQSLHREIGALLNIPLPRLQMSLLEVPASWVMEGGHVLPEPGEEDQCDWLQQESQSA